MRRWFGNDLKFDFSVVFVTIASTMILMVDNYFNLTPLKQVDRLILYFLLPMLVILIVFRRSPMKYGFQLGDWKAGILITFGAIIFLAPVIWFVVRASGDMQSYYQTTDITTRFFLLTLMELISWEFFFRGFIYFCYQEKFGDHALWLQAVPFAMAHLTKPAVETLTTLFGGFLFGLVARRTRSFLYPFLIHLFVALFTKYSALSMV